MGAPRAECRANYIGGNLLRKTKLGGYQMVAEPDVLPQVLPSIRKSGMGYQLPVNLHFTGDARKYVFPNPDKAGTMQGRYKLLAILRKS